MNTGIKQIWEKVDPNYKASLYAFRHSWATIAQNECGATLNEVDFGLNHSVNKMAKVYVKVDYSPAWILNEKVIDSFSVHFLCSNTEIVYLCSEVSCLYISNAKLTNLEEISVSSFLFLHCLSDSLPQVRSQEALRLLPLRQTSAVFFMILKLAPHYGFCTSILNLGIYHEILSAFLICCILLRETGMVS